MSTASKRRAEKRRWAHLNFQEKVAEVAAKRPPKIVAGVPSAFAVGELVEHDPTFGPDARKRYRNYTLGHVPSQRQVAIYIDSTSSPFFNRRAVDHVGRRARTEHFVAERWRCSFESEWEVANVDWFTWRHSSHEAKPAVHAARAILDRAAMLLDTMTTIPMSDHSIRAEAYRVKEYVETVREAAKEWLGEPDLTPKKDTWARERSRF